jgi:methionyl-tRNA formyltransferase
LDNVLYIGNLYRVAEYVYHAQDVELAAVVCEQGRQSDELYTFCVLRGIPLLPVDDANGVAAACSRYGVSHAVMCSFGWKLPADLLEKVDIYNIHYSALPDYRGRHPTFHALLNDEKSVGITLHRVTPEIDRGDIVAQQLVPNYFWDYEQQLFDALTARIPLLLETLSAYLRGEVQAQQNTGGSYFEPVTEALTSIDLQADSARDIFNKVRAQYRYGGCRMTLDETAEIRVSKLLFADPAQVTFPGEWYYDKEQGVVYARKGEVVLKITAFDRIKGIA